MHQSALLLPFNLSGLHLLYQLQQKLLKFYKILVEADTQSRHGKNLQTCLCVSLDDRMDSSDLVMFVVIC
jgi:hypothetical protein